MTEFTFFASFMRRRATASGHPSEIVLCWENCALLGRDGQVDQGVQQGYPKFRQHTGTEQGEMVERSIDRQAQRAENM
jgi:hypothetical protein